jgi:hypothetical protein
MHEHLMERSEALDEKYDEDWARRDWDLSLRTLHERPRRRGHRPNEPRGAPVNQAGAGADDPPPF